jgi:hypothetical protein
MEEIEALIYRYIPFATAAVLAFSAFVNFRNYKLSAKRDRIAVMPMFVFDKVDITTRNDSFQRDPFIFFKNSGDTAFGIFIISSSDQKQTLTFLDLTTSYNGHYIINNLEYESFTYNWGSTNIPRNGVISVFEKTHFETGSHNIQMTLYFRDINNFCYAQNVSIQGGINFYSFETPKSISKNNYLNKLQETMLFPYRNVVDLPEKSFTLGQKVQIILRRKKITEFIKDPVTKKIFELYESTRIAIDNK